MTREVTCGEEPLTLAPREFALLEYLIRSPGRVFTRSQILEHVWGYSFDPGTNVVDVCIQRLRAKIDVGRPESFIEAPPGEIEARHVVVRGDAEIDVDWTYEQTGIDWASETFSGKARIQVKDADRTLDLELPYTHRIFLPQEMMALVAAAGSWEVAEVFGDFHLGRIYGRTASPEYMIFLLRRLPGG